MALKMASLFAVLWLLVVFIIISPAAAARDLKLEVGVGLGGDVVIGASGTVGGGGPKPPKAPVRGGGVCAPKPPEAPVHVFVGIGLGGGR
eukprot:Gb_28308 [translate_table: standard]